MLEGPKFRTSTLRVAHAQMTVNMVTGSHLELHLSFENFSSWPSVAVHRVAFAVDLEGKYAPEVARIRE